MSVSDLAHRLRAAVLPTATRRSPEIPRRSKGAAGGRIPWWPSATAQVLLGMVMITMVLPHGATLAEPPVAVPICVASWCLSLAPAVRSAARRSRSPSASWRWIPHHTITVAAMIWMLLEMPAPVLRAPASRGTRTAAISSKSTASSMTSTPPIASAAVAAILAVYFLVVAVMLVDRLGGRRHTPAVLAEAAMSLGMGILLLLG